MRMMVLVAMVCGLLSLQAAFAQMYQTVEAEKAQILQQGPGAVYCPNCGMSLVKFYRTSHALDRPDGHTHQYCSLHCLVEANPGQVAGALVVDQLSLQFVPAATATYVVGSTKPGTMTMKSKYAFADGEAARAFAAEQGGEVMDFAGAVKIARAGLTGENKKIDGKRAQMAKRGEKIYRTFLQDTDLPAFDSIARAKTHVSGLEAAANLDDAMLQAVAVYLVREQTRTSSQIGPPIEVPAKAKCPVCGMFVAKYPQWAASYDHQGQIFYFDGVKDLMKFMLDPAAFGLKDDLDGSDLVQVTDYYTLGSLAGRLAFYVIGSDVYGPMGKELIPFAHQAEAETFLQDHSGDRILRFQQITPELLKQLDE